MDALPFDPVDLIACDPARNIRRRWQIKATRDLFGWLTVETRWGRIGVKGRSLVRSFVNEEAARRYVRELMVRRATSQRRIGVSYRQVTALPNLIVDM
jgi:predicted DNA-binding WGR domain protein